MIGAAPIIIRGAHCATLFAGQVFFDAPDIQHFRSQAVELGYDPNDYLKAIADVPVIEKKKLIDALAFLGDMAALIAEQGLNKLTNEETIRQTRQLEESVRTTLNSIGDAVIATDRDGRIQRMNDIAERLTGWSRDEAIGRELTAVFRIVNAQPRQLADNPVERALSTGDINGLANHTLLISRDGREFQIADSAAPIRDDSGAVSGIVLVFRDITDEYLLRAENEKALALLNTVIEQSPLGVIISGIDGQIIEVNAKMLEILGSPSADATKQLNLLTFPPLVKIGYSDALKRCATQKQTIVFETIYTSKWKKDCFLRAHIAPLQDADGNIEKLLTLAEDVTERKRAEEEVRRNAAFTSALLDSIPIPVYYKEKNGRYQGCNRAFTDITGLSAEDILNKTAAEIWPAEQAAVYEWKRLDFLKDIRPMSYEYVIRDKTGVLRPMIITNDAYRDEAGEISGIIGAFLDISEHKKMEESMRAARDRASLQRAAIASLATDEAITSGDLTAAAKSIALLTSETLNVRRVSVWLLSADQTELVCIAQSDYEAATVSVGLQLFAIDYPQYFKSILAENRINARDAQTDPRTREFAENYLIPLGIISMLDVSITVGGRLRGILCIEHTSEVREWLTDEEAFAGAVAALVGQGIANSERRRAEEALRHSEERFRDLVELLPEAVFETNEVMAITYANRRAIEMFGYEPGDLQKGEIGRASCRERV